MTVKFSAEEYRALQVAQESAAVDREVAQIYKPGKPDHVDDQTWDLIQETGREACARLHEIITGPRFSRLRAGDQAKLIKLAQERAFGTIISNRAEKKAVRTNTTAEELGKLADRARLPEYRKLQ
jgi:hypothetical protein